MAAADGPLLTRTREFGLRAIRLVDTLPGRRSCVVIGTQLLPSATSVGANYRAACRARSLKEFVAKLGVVEEEADESAYWLDMLASSGIVKAELLADLRREIDEIIAMVVASLRTAKRNLKAQRAGRKG